MPRTSAPRASYKRTRTLKREALKKLKEEGGSPQAESAAPPKETTGPAPAAEPAAPSNPADPAPPKPPRLPSNLKGWDLYNWAKARGIALQWIYEPYGIKSFEPRTPLDLEVTALLVGAPKPLPDRFEHFRNYLRLLWPGEMHPKKWNPWTERIMRSLLSDDYAVKIEGVKIKCVVLAGCAAASKTHSVGWFALAWWMMASHKSSVALTSTTKEMIGQRIWPVIQHYYNSAVNPNTKDLEPAAPLIGKKVDSEYSIRWIDNATGEPSKKFSITALAVAHGETQKAAHNLRGRHTERMMLVIDEANGTPEAILETIPNMAKGCKELVIVILGNPVSRLDPHGQAAEPENGWGSISESTIEWLTKGVERWQLPKALCLRFDGFKSPNVLAGRDQWPFLYSVANHVQASRPNAEKTRAYWSQDRGMWPPDGVSNTIFSESMLTKYGPGYLRFDSKDPLSFCDPAFGGDDCVIQFGEFGVIAGTGDIDLIIRDNSPRPSNIGKVGIQLTDRIIVGMEGTAKDERDYVVARRCIEECKLRGVRPQHFGIDRTGPGRGVAAIISAEWSSAIRQLEGAAMATERPSSTADHRPSREVYANLTTETWWETREFLEAGQLKGIDNAAATQFCSREYGVAGRKYRIMTKLDFKERFGYSPDEADAIVGLVDVARSNGAVPQTRNLRAGDKSWNEAARQLEPEPVTYGTRPEQELVEMGSFETSGGWAMESIW